MAVLGTNACGPTRIYGPLPQTLFCGCSIIGLSVQAGWNEQSSSVTVELVQDTCVGPKVWYDGNMYRQSGNIADPGFTYPEPGVPAYLRIEENSGTIGRGQNRGGFEYSGLIEGWTERKDANGNPVFSVRLVDPRAILENVQLILGDYPGRVGPRNSTEKIYNVINVYGFLEYLGSYQGKPCVSSPAGGMGGVTAGNVLGFYNGNPIGLIANEQGMSWTDIRCAIQTLTSLLAPSQVPRSDFDFFCKGQTILYVGATSGGYGILNADTTLQGVGPGLSNKASRYTIDLTEIPFAPLYYRMSGPQASLLEVISQICTDAGYDYYCELQIVRNGGSVQRVIKIRVAKRGSAPQWGKLQEFINTKISQATSANGGVISYTTGAELRNEVTSNLLIGGNVRTPYFISPPALMPYWGLDADGYLIEAYTTGFNGEWEVAIDASRLNATLYTPFAGRFPIVSERELRAALADIDSWLSVTFLVGGTVYNHLLSIGVNSSSLNFDTLSGASINNKSINSIPKAIWSNGINFAEQESVDVETIYNFIKSYADEFYGKQFLISANFVCYAIDYAPALSNFGAKAKFRYSHLPSTEGGWVEDNISNVIGMNHPSSATDFFRDELGKFQPILKFNMYGSPLLNGSGTAACSPAYLSTDEYLINTDGDTGEVWCKADIEPYWVHGIPTDTAGNYISAVLKISAPVVKTDADFDQTGSSFGGLGMIRNNQGVTGSPQYISPSPFIVQILNKAVLPIYAVVPVLSNVDSYGPWGVNGLPGQTNLEIDESFVPWEFGSNSLMGIAALDKVASSASNTRKAERGTITVAGFPNLPLGCEIMAADSSDTAFASQFNRQRYLETRIASRGNCTDLNIYLYIQMNAWEGLYGPNITGINCNIGADGFTTTYEFSTYTPVYGRFNKNNSERLKQIGQSRLSLSRTMRSKALLRDVVQTKRSMMNSISARFLKGTSSKAPNSPHSVMVGNYTNDGRVNAFSNPIKDMPYSFSSEAVYSTAAMMSLDGLYRPVSKAGDGGLPRFINSTGGNCVKAYSNSPDPPQVTKLNITRTGLDPLANPSDSLVTSNNSTSGHDIDVVAKGATLTGNYYTTKEGGYASDYRFWALKGPIVIQSWGYDIEGKPVPNQVDTTGNASAGTFASTGLKDKFLQNWLQQPKTWPVAPLDLRLDRERGVWTIPSNFRNVHVTSTGCLLSDKSVTINNAKAGLTDAAGTALGNTGTVEWPWTIKPPHNPGKFPVYYDSYDCKLYAFPINRLDVATGTGTATYEDVKRIVFKNATVSQTEASSTGCINTVIVEFTGGGGGGTGCFAGLNTGDLPVVSSPSFVLTMTGNCLAKVPVEQCDSDSGVVIYSDLTFINGPSGEDWVINQEAVTLPKIQPIPPYTLLGNTGSITGMVTGVTFQPWITGLLNAPTTGDARNILDVYSRSETILMALIFG